MADEPENLALLILQEVRDEMRDMPTGLGDIDGKLTDLGQRVDGNTLLLKLVAGVVHDHESRIDKLVSR